MGFLLYLVPDLHLNLQLIIFTIISIFIIIMGKKYKKTNQKSTVGQSKEHVGTVGIITKTIELNKIGKLKPTLYIHW